MNKLNGRITANATLRGAMTRGAGGGTYVEANPEGEATDTLEKLMVESDIFEIRNVPDATSAQNGDVLTKIASGVTWLPQTKELPTYTSGNNGNVLKIINDGVQWAYDGIVYSTEEIIIGKWLDNKPIYQKTFVLPSPISLNERSEVAINLGSTGAEINLIIDSQFYRTGASEYGPSVGYMLTRKAPNSSNIMVYSYVNYGNVNVINLRYTKVGD